MRLNRFALAAVLIFAAGRCFAQQQGANAQPQQPQAQGQQPRAQGGGQQQGQQRQQGPEQAAEQQLQEAQRVVREGQQGRGNAGLGGGQPQGRGGAQAQPEDPDVDAYMNTDDLFSVSVPCKFATKDITWATEYDSKVPGRVYNCKSGDTEYEMSVINYTDILKIRAAQQHTDAAQGDAYARIDLAASIDYACTRMRNEAAKVTYDAWHYINLIPGHELQYNLPNGRRVYAAVYLHEFRLYIMKATAAPNGIPPLLYTQSFAVVRPDGSAVRYATIYRHPW
jgi:hypothetical protein